MDAGCETLETRIYASEISHLCSSRLQLPYRTTLRQMTLGAK